jgi:hypothetical protein
LLDPGNHGGVVDAGDPLNPPKPQAIHIHPQTDPFDISGIPFLGFIDINKLATAINANVILFAFLLAIFANMGRLAGNVLDLWMGDNGGSCFLALICDGA